MYETLVAFEAGETDGWSESQLSISTPLGSRSVAKMPPAERIRWRDYWKRQVDAEDDAARIARGLGSRNIIRVRMP
jgi:hypothetical protein